MVRSTCVALLVVLILGCAVQSSPAPPKWALAIHGGAGVIQRSSMTRETEAAYRAALEVRTHAQLPQDWAATQNNLGVVLSALGTRAEGSEGLKYLNDAVDAYRAALSKP